jgi:uncharacterized membrane protein YfcA
MLGLALGAVFLGGLSRGFTGFGAALIIIPALIIVYGPVPAVVLMSLIEVPGVLQLARTAIREADWRGLAPLCIAASITIPIGAWSLAVFDPETTRRFIAAIVVLFAVLIATGWRYKGEITKTLSVCIGTISGFCSGVASLGGPPVVMFLLAKGSNAAQTRAGIVAYFSLAMIMRLAAFGWHDLYSQGALLLSLLMAPVYMAGIWIGNQFFKGASELLFRRVVVALVLVMGVIALVK